MKPAALVLLVALLTGCDHSLGPRLLWTGGTQPVVALATVRAAGASRALAVDPQGGSQWLTATGQMEPGPQLAAGLSRLVASDLNSDGQDELVGVSRGEVTAWDTTGRVRWRYPTPTAKVNDLAASPDGRSLLLLATPPVSVTALGADGKRLWHDPLARTAWSGAAWQGGWMVALDTRLLQRYDTAGRKLGTWKPALSEGPGEVVPTAVGATGGLVAVLGWTQAERVRLVWSLLNSSGRPIRSGLGGAQPLVGRDRILASTFAGDGGVGLAAVGPEAIYWLGADGLLRATATGPRPVLCSGLGPPDPTGRTPVLLGTTQGVAAWGW